MESSHSEIKAAWRFSGAYRHKGAIARGTALDEKRSSREILRGVSEANVDLIKRGIALFNRKDWDAAIELVAEDAVWRTYFGRLSGEKSRYGREAIRRSWEDAAEVFGGDIYQAEPREFRDLGGGTVLVRAVLSGRGTASGVDVEAEYVQLWTVRDGLAVRVDSYATVAEALEAAGLSE